MCSTVSSESLPYAWETPKFAPRTSISRNILFLFIILTYVCAWLGRHTFPKHPKYKNWVGGEDFPGTTTAEGRQRARDARGKSSWQMTHFSVRFYQLRNVTQSRFSALFKPKLTLFTLHMFLPRGRRRGFPVLANKRFTFVVVYTLQKSRKYSFSSYSIFSILFFVFFDFPPFFNSWDHLRFFHFHSKSLFTAFHGNFHLISISSTRIWRWVTKLKYCRSVLIEFSMEKFHFSKAQTIRGEKIFTLASRTHACDTFPAVTTFHDASWV